MPTATPTPGKRLLDPGNHALILIDFQSQMSFATRSIDAVNLRDNAALIAHAAAGFKVPTILTTVAEKSFSGPMFSEITDAFPHQAMLDRTSMNTWEDAAVIGKVNEFGKSRIVLAGLWTSVCIVGPALSAIDQGFEVFVIADASGTFNSMTQQAAWSRMEQAGAQLMTWFGAACELHRDWRNDIEGLGTLFSNHIPDYRNLITSYNTLTSAK